MGAASDRGAERIKAAAQVQYLGGYGRGRMTGKTIEPNNLTYPVAYRLFDRAELNVNGPFYSGNAFNSQAMANIRGFLPNTREAR